MSDDLGMKIKQITDMLSKEDLPDNLRGILSLFGGSGTGNESPAKANDAPSAREEKPVRTEMDESLEMMRKAKKIMDGLNNTSDPRVNLLIAIKPFLNSRRQKRLGNCVRMIQMSGLARLFNESEKESF